MIAGNRDPEIYYRGQPGDLGGRTSPAWSSGRAPVGRRVCGRSRRQMCMCTLHKNTKQIL